MDGWTYGWIDGVIDVWIDGWMNDLITNIETKLKPNNFMEIASVVSYRMSLSCSTTGLEIWPVGFTKRTKSFFD